MTVKEARARWTQALRSGAYPQDRDRLRTFKGFCCLGVLCDLVAEEKGWEWSHGPTGVPFLLDAKRSFHLNPPPELMDSMGITVPERNKLADMNDSEMLNFDEIADYIDSLPLRKTTTQI